MKENEEGFRKVVFNCEKTIYRKFFITTENTHFFV